jgi:hypothetical protein
MSKNMMSASIAAAWLACGLAVAAQGADMKPAASAGRQAAPSSAVTIAGCVQKESAVLKRSAAAGDMGMGDEFVLVQAALNPPSTPTDETPTASGPFGKVYRATGDKEAELKAYVGQRVEITGAFKNDDDAKAELAVGTSGKPVTGELTTANTPEITIAAIKPVPGSCAPAIAK